MIRTVAPEADKGTELLDLLKNSQIHRHTKTCHKFKNKCCRFHSERYFTYHTIIAEPLASTIGADVKVSLIEKINKVLRKVKEYTDTHLNPSTKNFYDLSQDFFEPALSI